MYLGVNIDHSATLREVRYKGYSDQHYSVEPNILSLAQIAEKLGVNTITVHLREDCRHIQQSDVFRLKKHLKIKMNLEIACTKEMLEFASKIIPYQVCIVPEKRNELTTEGGLDLNLKPLTYMISQLKSLGIKVSLFIDPDSYNIEKSFKIGADVVELHTGSFANNYYTSYKERELNRLINSAKMANSLNLIVHAGHGINYINIKDIVKIPHISELNIGHSILSRSLFVGFEKAIKEIKNLMDF